MLVGLATAAAILCGVGALVVAIPRAIAGVFSTDDDVLAAFVSARYTLALATVLMNLAVVLEGLLMTTGRTRAVLLVGLAGSWLGQVPAVFLLLRFWRKALSAVYLGVSVGYGLLCILLATTLCRLDWEAVAAEAAARAQPATRPLAAAAEEVQDDCKVRPPQSNQSQSSDPERPGAESSESH
jgi:Na+-driven multidrug efflux pump